MSRKHLVILSFLFIVSFSTTAQTTKPKLVVGLVIDQMRWDYLYRYSYNYGNGGFKRLLKEGFSAENTMIPYIPTVTGAGHTCIYTGSVPAIHGIVANDWVDRETGVFMYCAKDTTVQPVGSNSIYEGQMSPRNMLTNTIGDELKLANNFKGKVIGIALKDRGGILPAGHSADAAYWFDNKTAKWITSTYYMNELPTWVTQFNNKKYVDEYVKNDWNLLYPLSKYQQSTADDMPYEKILESDKGRTFPHKYQSIIGSNNYDAFRASPFGNTYTLQFAKETINNEKMGATNNTDMLCISISGTDYLGHRFGPNSIELEDAYLRLDKDIEDFLNFLDIKIGRNQYTLFLSADHGSPQIGEYLKSKKYFTAGSLNSNSVIKNINTHCKQKFGIDSIAKKIYEYDLYLNHQVIDNAGLNKSEIKKEIVAYLKTIPEVWNAFDKDDFSKTILPSVIKERLSNSYYFRRSGDVQYFYKPQYTDYTKDGLEHGAWYPYDAHIPCLFYGWGVKPGKIHRETYMTDIAPTIAAILKIQMPNGCVGKVIEEVVK
ncbi:MAG: alkaline phosphatase family protein [Ferruginibacter sp.]|nr:alkaline phosphatase family protein [Ferruginibacter sp.]